MGCVGMLRLILPLLRFCSHLDTLFQYTCCCFSGLANFAGSICRKYQVELAGLMQYVANQLKAGKRCVKLYLEGMVFIGSACRNYQKNGPG